MPYDNNVTIVGNMTRDAELRFTPSGTAVASFGVACNRAWTDKVTQAKKEQTSFYDVTCWGGLGENVASSLYRGCRVVVTGRLEQQTWETPEGDKRSKIQIVADEVSPSLRWATCTVAKTERRSPEGGQQYQPQPAGGGYQPPDEEPF